MTHKISVIFVLLVLFGIGCQYHDRFQYNQTQSISSSSEEFCSVFEEMQHCVDVAETEVGISTCIEINSTFLSSLQSHKNLTSENVSLLSRKITSLVSCLEVSLYTGGIRSCISKYLNEIEEQICD